MANMEKITLFFILILCSCKVVDSTPKQTAPPLPPSYKGYISPRLQITSNDRASAIVAPSKQIYLVWSGVWSNYIIEYKTNLNSTNWIFLGNTQSNRWKLLFIDQQRYYRVGGY